MDAATVSSAVGQPSRAQPAHDDPAHDDAATVDPARVAAAVDALPTPADLADLADVLGLLGDPTRLALLLALRAAGELCVTDLAAVTGHSESGVSHALRLLRAHRVVAVRRVARLGYYRLADEHVRELLDLAVAHLGHVEVVHPERGR